MLNEMLEVIVLLSVGQRGFCETHFMQDEAPPHSVLDVPAWLGIHFTCRWIGRGKTSDWSPRSTGLKTCDFLYS
jgi:hypothetical protein